MITALLYFVPAMSPQGNIFGNASQSLCAMYCSAGPLLAEW
jgi:hypothetical protein